MLLVPNNSTLQVVEREVIGDLVSVGVLHDIAPHDLLLRLLAWADPVLKLGLVEDLRHVHALKVTLQKIESGRDILRLHLAQAWRRCYIWQFVSVDLTQLCAAVRQR